MPDFSRLALNTNALTEDDSPSEFRPPSEVDAASEVGSPSDVEAPLQSSKQLARADLADPSVAHWYIDKLIGAVHCGSPIGPGACYLATNLRRHLDARLAQLRAIPRLEPALGAARARLDQASHVAERLEGALGQLVGVSGVYRVLAARELTRHLEHLREHLDAARDIELEVTMRAEWEDLGTSG